MNLSNVSFNYSKHFSTFNARKFERICAQYFSLKKLTSYPTFRLVKRSDTTKSHTVCASEGSSNFAKKKEVIMHKCNTLIIIIFTLKTDFWLLQIRRSSAWNVPTLRQLFPECANRFRLNRRFNFKVFVRQLPPTRTYAIWFFVWQIFDRSASFKHQLSWHSAVDGHQLGTHLI